jgi:hypothetical protein
MKLGRWSGATAALRAVLVSTAITGGIAGRVPAAAATALQQPPATEPDSSRRLPDGLNVAIGARAHSNEINAAVRSASAL